MNISFESKIYVNTEFLDFLLALLKPTKISPPTSYLGKTISIKGADFMPLSELKRRLEEWSGKYQNDDSIDFKVTSIELSDEDKLKAEKLIVFEKALH